MSWRSSSSRRKCPRTTLDPGLPLHLTILPRSAFFRVCTSTGSALFVLLCILSVYLESVPSSVTEVDALIGCLDICCCRDVFHVDQGVRRKQNITPRMQKVVIHSIIVPISSTKSRTCTSHTHLMVWYMDDGDKSQQNVSLQLIVYTMGQKFSSWKKSHKEKRIAQEREQEMERKKKQLHQQ